MQKLIAGFHHFQSNVFSKQKELFSRLSEGQSPDALFITCSDSRVDPSLIMQSKPGDLFILRNAGNIVPAYGTVVSGEVATIEFAIVALGVKDIIVCGHSLCGAVNGLLNPDSLGKLPSVKTWLSHADAAKRIVDENYCDLKLDKEQTLNVAIQENVLVQLENLKTHPAVAAALARGVLNLHGWVYKFQTGEVFAYDQEKGQFLPVTEVQNVRDDGRPQLASKM